MARGQTVEDAQDELNQLRTRLENAKANKARLEGVRDAALEDLKKLGCKSVAEAEKKAAKLEAQGAEFLEQVSNGLAKAQKDFAW